LENIKSTISRIHYKLGISTLLIISRKMIVVRTDKVHSTVKTEVLELPGFFLLSQEAKVLILLLKIEGVVSHLI
jgi:hypothetical protein